MSSFSFFFLQHPQHKIEKGNVSRSFKHKSKSVKQVVFYFAYLKIKLNFIFIKLCYLVRLSGLWEEQLLRIQNWLVTNQIIGSPAAQKTQTVKEWINFFESTAIHASYGLNSFTCQQLVKCGEYGYISEDVVNQGGFPFNRSEKAPDLEVFNR